MAPTPPQEGVHIPSGVLLRPPPGEEVVISGISGVFPKSENTTEFLQNLYKNVDMVTEHDLNFHHPEAPRHLGQINGLNKFDAQFFRVTYHHALTMEPVSRKLLEHAYTAMYDSGINPLALKGKKVGVFIGTSFSDTSNVAMYHTSKQKGLVLSGCGKSMFSNRISYWIDAVGPSYSVDCSCASSMVCLENAFQAMVNGDCEAAVVGGGNICKLPQLGLNFRMGGLASLDGKTKCFDKNGDGTVRAEAISCIFLQKAKDAKRIYAEVYYSQIMYGLREDAHFLPTRRSDDIAQFLKNFYSSIDVPPSEVDYVEMDGSAIVDADVNELKAIADVFTKEKHKPLKVGSVKSNMGHSEPASGVCALTKVCLAYHEGKLPANLHFTEPVDVHELKEGKIKVVQQNEYFDRGFTAINQFAYNGTNCHVLLKGHYKPKDVSKYKTNIPRLVLVSGREDKSVQKIFNTLESQPIDPEIIGMLHNIYQIDTPGHTSRGYTIIDTDENNKTVSLSQNVNYYSGAQKPLCLVFSGMGSQWLGMAKELMKIPTFASTIQRCHKVLEPLDVNLIHVLTGLEKTIFDNILHCFVGISAVQIGLTDVLKELGVDPDYIIGHSQGEMCCAYWDNCFTTEEAILAAYSRGIVSYELDIIKGSMAAVGLGYKEILPLCPPEIDVACHNSGESSTLSGPADVVKKFVAELEAKGIFAREVPSANIPFHSRYVKPAGPEFSRRLKKVMSKPKLRSEKWICTSVPQEKWHEDYARYASAEFHTNNLVSPVLFEEGARLIPKNAVIVEVAPHGLLQAILKRSHPECTHVPLTRRSHENPVKFFFEAIGKLYQEGFNFKLDVLFPKIEYPVATETDMISHYVDWEHSEDWPETVSNSNDMVMAASREFVISVQDDEFKFIAGHVREGNNVFAESALLVLVWETLANYNGVDYKDLSVIFQDIQFHAEAIITAEEPLKFNVVINKGNDYFEITSNEIVLINGFIVKVLKPQLQIVNEVNEDEENIHSNKFSWESDVSLSSDDIYTHFHSKSLSYKGEFQSIKSSNFKCNSAQIKWTENFTTLLDSLIQLNILIKDVDCVTVPKIIKKLTIDVDEFRKEKYFTSVDNVKCVDAKIYDEYSMTRCCGIEMKHIIFEQKPIEQQKPDVLKSQVFVPFAITEQIHMEAALQLILQIVSDNTQGDEITVTEINNDYTSSVSGVLENISEYLPNINVKVRKIAMKKVNSLETSNLVILLHVFNNGTNISDVLNTINDKTFILTFDQTDLHLGYFDVVSSMKVLGNKLVLLRKTSSRNEENKTYLPIENDDKFTWVPILRSELQKTKHVVLVSEKNPHCGLFGLVKNLRKKYPNKISLVVVDDYNVTFDKNKVLFSEQLQKNLAVNILHKGLWGSYTFLQISTHVNVKNFKLASMIPGDIDCLQWVETPSTASCENLVQVCYAGPSVRDSQKVIGMVDYDGVGFGYDFSGYDTNGDRVMGLISGAAIASTVQAEPQLLWQVPTSWTLEDAATVPLPYIHAFYCLAIKGQLQKGHNIFVNGGAGAFGQAVISTALSLDCTVFTSVSDTQKKKLLLKLFPKLQEDNICKSQNGEFHPIILLKTNGVGCDFVLNSASGYQREIAMKCTAPYGIFMDVNDVDWRSNKPLGMSYITCDRTYKAVNLSCVFRPDNISERKQLQGILAQGIINGVVRPISRVVYPTTEVSRAFRLLTSNRHRGRALFKMRNADIPANSLNIIARMTYSPSGTYVVVCDDSEIGIELANRFVNGGARKIMLHLKSKKVPGFMHMKFATWMKLGTEIKISTEKLHVDKNCTQFLNEAEKLGRIQGIFIIQETSVNNDKWEQNDFVEKYETNSRLVANLDVISRNNCPELRNFVVISRSSENVVDEFITSVSHKICENRQKVGLAATNFKIELLDELHTDCQNCSVAPQNITTALNALETSVKQKQTSTITFNLKKRRLNEYISKVLRCLNVDNMESRLTVNDVITNDIKLEELKTIIKYTCKIDYTTEKLKLLSICSLRNLQNKGIKQSHKSRRKLGAFFTFVDNDEYMATNAVVPMKTIVYKNVESNELNENATHLLLIPGFEGHHQIFNSVCERLKVRAATFQIGPDYTTQSIPAIASEIYKLIKRKFVFKKSFYLLGYSFGVNVALEVASLLEKEGYTGIVYCLDSSPNVLEAQLDAYIGRQTDSQIQNSIVKHFFRLMSGRTDAELSEEIEELNSWSDKVDACVNKLKSLVTYSIQYMRNVIDSAYGKILLAKSYKPCLRLKSELVLLKGLPHPDSEKLGHDYGLSEYTTKQVTVIDIASDHATAPYDCRISNIVNRFIDPTLLECNKTSLCNTYLVE